MNILTFDIEEWALAKARGYGNVEKYAEYDALLNRILNVLDERNIKATFFCTGLMAQDFPQVVKLIQCHGHEIGCHSNRHAWMNKMTEAEAREDTHAAISALEQCIGQKITSYRAPAFSICNENKWMFGILAENGIEVDSSVYPSLRDFGGFPTFGSMKPCIVKCGGISLREFPVGLTHVLGKDIAYSGGGYFRFFPMSFIKQRIAKNDYTMCYFHINDFLSERGKIPSKEMYESYFKEKGTLKNRYMRYIKSNIGKKGAWMKLEKLIRMELFVNIGQGCEIINWNEAKTIEM